MIMKAAKTENSTIQKTENKSNTADSGKVMAVNFEDVFPASQGFGFEITSTESKK